MGFKDMLNLVVSSENEEGGETPKAEKKKRIDPKDDEFLDKISQLESSGGKNTNHKPVKGGLNEGDSATTEFGLMPKTVADAIRLYKKGKLKGDLENLKDLTPEALAQRLRDDPDAAKSVARAHAGYLRQKTGGDEEAMAYRWRMGTYDEKAKDPNVVGKHPYVKAFRKLGSKHDKRIGKIVENDEQQTNDGTGEEI